MTATPTMAKGKPLSYTQNMEDYHLWLAVGGKAEGFYIDVGGGHPVADNVSFWFYERGWRGIVAEPQQRLAAMYARVRPRDCIVTALVGREKAEADFHVFDRLHGLSTMVADLARGARVHGDDYRVERRPVLPLSEICAANDVTTIDVLKIDVEGGEKDVLAGNDWTRFRPKVVVAEAIDAARNEPAWQAWEPFLLAQGYRFRLDDTLNRFYVAEEEPEVFERLPAVRAPWDAVTHMYEIGRAPENADHPDHELAMALARGLWASLPELDAALISALAARSGGRLPVSGTIDSDDIRAALARIACGYDGGQIIIE